MFSMFITHTGARQCLMRAHPEQKIKFQVRINPIGFTASVIFSDSELWREAGLQSKLVEKEERRHLGENVEWDKNEKARGDGMER